jgi:NAD(P)-dependent dehydrogenase (short-subunit alcohol dehydrogenase family)
VTPHSQLSLLRRLADASDDNVQIMALDVTDLASIKAAATELEGQAIDLLLNNAGVGGPRGQKIGNIDYEAWANVLDVNTLGPLRVSEAFADHVARSERKLIVTLTSGMGSIADNTSGGAFAYRSRPARHHLCCYQSGLGTDRHGRDTWNPNPG